MKERPVRKHKDSEFPEFPDQEVGAYRTLALAEHEDETGGVNTFTPSEEQVENAREWSEENKL